MADPADSGHMTPAIDAEREALLKTLVAHHVQFVVIGGAGIQSRGRRYDTLDIDLTPDRDEANLQRLADALTSSTATSSPVRPTRPPGCRSHPTTSHLAASSPPQSGTWRRDTASSTSRSPRAASLAATENSRPGRSASPLPALASRCSWLP
jgi:hypothetical protein